MTLILGLGNRLVPSDDAGPRVVARLRERPLPETVECVEGGTRGLSLLGLLEGTDRVVFVDQVRGFGPPGTVHRIDPSEVAAEALGAGGHEAGLPELLRLLPQVLDGPLPEVRVVGVESADGPLEDATLDSAADLALSLAREGPA